MIIYDAAATFPPPALIAPEVQPVKKRGRSKARRKTAGLAVGMVLIMEDGSRCQLVGFAANGHPLCAPISH